MGWLDLFGVTSAAALSWWVIWTLWPSQAEPEAGLDGNKTRARQWLEANGYQIVREGERAEWIGYYDNRAFHKPLLADFIVSKGAHLYVVKISDPALGGKHTAMSGSRLREDWYPLAVAFGVDGVMYIDIDGESVHVIDFEVRSPRYVTRRRAVNRIWWLLSGALLMFVWLYRG